jgi:hypothetical protein
MEWWQFAAAVQGWKVANGQGGPKGDMTDERLRELGIEGFD